MLLFAFLPAALCIIVACSSVKDNCEHNFVEVSRKEYCTQDGIIYLECAKCGHLAEERLDPIGHDEVIINAVSATCTTNGSTEGKACNRCGEQIIVPEEIIAGHQIEIIPAKPETCTENGLTEGKFCPVCNTVTEPQQSVLAEHKFEITAAIEPTCTENGRTEGEACVRCGLVSKESHNIPAGHTIEFLGALAETCTTDGHTAGYFCTECNLVLSGIDVIPAAHKSVILPGKEGYAATCTSTGMSPETVCTECHAVTSTQKEIPMAEHSFKTVAGYAATCSSEGLTDGSYCTVCGYPEAEQQIIPMLNHISSVVSGYDAGCTAAGLTDGEECQLCGYTLKAQSLISPKGHSLGKDGVCTACGISVTAELIYEPFGNGQYIVAGLTEGAVPTIIFIPETYNDASVVGIKDRAFDSTVSIEKIIVPKTIEFIGENAFYNCIYLKVIELADILQIKDLGDEWYKNLSSELKIIASLYNGKNPYEVYVAAMNAIGDSYTMDSTFNTYIAREGEMGIILSTLTHSQINGQDFLEWTEEMDFLSGSVSSQLSLGYIDGYLYFQDNRHGLCKTAISYEDLLDFLGTEAIKGTPIRMKPEDFRSSVFYLDLNGEMHISLDLSAERFTTIALEMIPEADLFDAFAEDCKFECSFDRNGSILSYGFSAVKNGEFKIEGICEITNIGSTAVDDGHPILRGAILI